jgi:CheY-like chemotaxis protein
MSAKYPKVMVIEDEGLLLQAIGKKLEVNGIEVVSCTSGEQALDYLKNFEQLPDCIWLDYQLKDMNGLVLMQKLKESDKWKDIPVVVVSNSASPDKVSSMLALGAKKYLLKAEHRLDEIVGEIKEFIVNEEAEKNEKNISS